MYSTSTGLFLPVTPSPVPYTEVSGFPNLYSSTMFVV